MARAIKLEPTPNRALGNLEVHVLNPTHDGLTRVSKASERSLRNDQERQCSASPRAFHERTTRAGNGELQEVEALWTESAINGNETVEQVARQGD